MNSIIKYGLIAAVIGGIYLFYISDEYAVDDIDLNAVLDVTVDTLYSYQDSLEGQEKPDSDTAFLGFAERLEADYNGAQPPLHTKTIGVSPQTDASLLAFEDTNVNKTMDQGEDALFLIEIDGENARIIATSRSGAVSDHHFSGTSLLAGYLIGSMLSRQRAAGVSSQQLASKKPVTAKAAARARAGSGSHARGK